MAERDQVKISCEGCGAETFAAQKQISGGGSLYCSSCLVETNCQKCGRALTLSKDKFAEVGGNPICMNCDNSGHDSTQSTRTPLWAYLVLGFAIALSVAVFSPTVSPILAKHEETITTVAGPGLVIILAGIWKLVKSI